MKKISLWILAALLTGASASIQAQSLGGTDFWFTFPLNFANGQTGTPGQNQIVLVSGCEVQGTYSFPALGGAEVPFTVSPGVATTIEVPANNNTANEVVQNNGIHIVTDNLVSAYAVDYLPFTVDGETMLPTSMLGTDHVLMSYGGQFTNLYAQYTVLATEDNTQVTITTKAATSANRVTISHAAGSTWTVTLNKGQTYMVGAAANSGVGSEYNLSGSRVRSNKPIVVVAHTPCVNYPDDEYPTCDMIMSQMMPINLWGTKYITAQAQNRATNFCGDEIEVVTGSLPANYTLNGTGFTLAAYSTRRHPGNINSAPKTGWAAANCVIISDNPIQVSQFSLGAQCDNTGVTDPEHIAIYPESMWISDYTFSCSTLLTTTAAGITIVTDGAGGTAGFEMDGAALPAGPWLSIGTSTYVYKRIAVVPGPHHIYNTNNKRFSFYQYAVGDDESYIIQGGSTYTNCLVAGCLANFTYPGTPYCKTDANPTPVMIGAAVADTFTATPAGLVFVDPNTGQIDLAASTPGTYTVTNTVNNGECSATATVTITAPSDASFTYNPPYCKNAANPLPTFSGNAVAGTFSASAGVTIDPATGEINLAASTAGSHTITNTVAAVGGCPAATATTTVMITALPVATFSYTQTPYCKTAVNPSPTFSGGGAAGTFTAVPNGLSINPSTGVVNLAASTAGTYTVTNTIAASGGCPQVTANNIIKITAPQVGTFSYNGPYCQDAPNPMPIMASGSVAGTFSGSGPGLIINTSTGEITLLSSTAGSYTVTNTLPASGGCPSQTFTTTVQINPIQNAAFAYSTSTFCKTGSNPTPTISGTPGGTFSVTPAGLNFANPNTGQINISASALGTYNITYTTPGPCARSKTAVVTITNSPVATFTLGGPYCKDAANVMPVYTGGGTAGTFTASPAGLVFSNTATGEIDMAASTPGTYTVTNTIPASGGCVATSATSPVTIVAMQNSSFDYGSDVFCIGTSTALPVSLGSSGGTFTAAPAGLVFADNTTGEIDLLNSAPNTYTITYTTPGPCATTTSRPLIITTVPLATFSFAASPYCQNGVNPGPVFAPGATGGVFSSTPGLVIDAVTGIVDLAASTPGTYTVTNSINSGGGCPPVSATAQIIITALPKADFSYTGSPYCLTSANPQVTLGAGATAGTYSSTAGISVNPSTGEIDLAASLAGAYVVTNTIPAAGGCPVVVATTPVTLTKPLTGTFSYNGPYCQGDAPNPVPVIAPGSVPGSFSGTPGLIFAEPNSGLIDLVKSSPGQHTVTNTLSSQGGCPLATFTAGVQIDAIQDPGFSYPSSVICKGSSNPSATISGTTGGTFSVVPSGLVFANTWTGEIDLAATKPGAYVITYQTPGPCARSGTFSLTITNSATATFSYTASPYCLTSANPAPVFSGGSIAGTFSATPAGLSINTATGLINLANSAAGTYTVTNTLSPAGGCPAITHSTSITLTAPSQALFNYPGTPYCQNSANPAPVFGSGAIPGSFAAIPSGLAINTNTGLVDLANSIPNTYTVTNSIAAAGGCPATSATANITITALPKTDFSFPGSPFCPNGAKALPSLIPGASNGVYSSTPAGLSINTATGEINPVLSKDGNYTVTNTIAAAGGCPAVTASSPVTILKPLVQTVSNDLNLCYGTNFTLAATVSGGAGSYVYSWRNSDNVEVGTGASLSDVANASETFTIRTMDNCGTAINSVEVDVSEPVIVNFTAPETMGCAPFTPVLANYSTGDYDDAQWFINNVPVDKALQQFSNTFTIPGTYDITLQLTNKLLGCTYNLTRQAYITVFPKAVAAFSYQPEEVTLVDPKVTLHNASESAGIYTWTMDGNLLGNKDELQVAFNKDTAGVYKICLDANNIHNCPDAICKIVVVKEEMTIYVPTVFTPNDDGKNDVFKPVGMDIEVEDYLFVIYDRWGEILFSTTDLSKGWDGTYKGKKVENEIYAWKLQARTKNQSYKIQRTGKVLVSR